MRQRDGLLCLFGDILLEFVVCSQYDRNLEIFDIAFDPIFVGTQVAATKTPTQMDRFGTAVYHCLGPSYRVSAAAPAAGCLTDELNILVVLFKGLSLILKRSETMGPVALHGMKITPDNTNLLCH
jgi:hypothetical protein